MTLTLWKTWRATGAQLAPRGAHRPEWEVFITAQNRRGTARQSNDSRAPSFPQVSRCRNCFSWEG